MNGSVNTSHSDSDVATLGFRHTARANLEEGLHDNNVLFKTLPNELQEEATVPLMKTDEDDKKEKAIHATRQKPTSRTSFNNLLWCDGIRGWASQVVIAYHACGRFKLAVPALPGYTEYLRRFVYAGDSAVETFFVLSGFVLSLRFFGRLLEIETASIANDSVTVEKRYGEAFKSMCSTTLRRIPRLLGPVVTSAVFAGIMVAFGGFQWIDASLAITTKETGAETHEHFNSINIMNEDERNIVYFLHEALVRVVVKPGNPWWNTPLWSIREELVGSVFTFFYCLMVAKLRYYHRVTVCCIGIMLFNNNWANYSYNGSFLLGILLADIIMKEIIVGKDTHKLLPFLFANTGSIPKLYESKYVGYIANTLFAVIQKIADVYNLITGAYYAICSKFENNPVLIATSTAFYTGIAVLGVFLFQNRQEEEYYYYLLITKKIFARNYMNMLWRFGAVCMLYGTQWSPIANRFFSHPISRFLGQISFMFYLLHMIVINTLGDFLIIQLVSNFGWEYYTASWYTVGAVWVSSTVLAYLATVHIDEPYVKFLGRLERAVELKAN